MDGIIHHIRSGGAAAPPFFVAGRMERVSRAKKESGVNHLALVRFHYGMNAVNYQLF